MKNNSGGGADVVAQMILLLFLVGEPAFTSVRFQTASPPRESAALAEWLRNGKDGGRIWQVLVGAPALARGTDTKEVIVEYLLSEVPPSKLETKLIELPSMEVSTLGLLGDVLHLSSPPLTGRLQQFMAQVAASRSRRLGASAGNWSREECEGLLMLQFVDPNRFVSDDMFRERVLDILPAALDPNVPRELKDLLLFSVNNVPGIDFWTSERIESAWKAIPRRSRERETSYDPRSFQFADDYSRPIEATVYSLPSRFFNATEALGFLKSVRKLSPRRTIVLLVDLPLRKELSSGAEGLGVHLIETHGRGYTPWPRDPFHLVRRQDEGVSVLIRPISQLNRNEDRFMGLELVQGLPPTLDDSWDRIQWVNSPVTFHNGQVLFTPERAWVSLHTLELRVLELLGIDAVPIENFGRESVWRAYLAAVRQAAGELRALYQREVAFVHPLPDKFESSFQVETMRGGAGFDLDSLVTVAEAAAGGEGALIGDLEAGTQLLQKLPLDDLETFRDGFGLAPPAQLLRQELVAAQDTDRARRLRAFLDLMASWFREKGMVVHRLPLFLVPVKLLAERDELHHEDFLITWNNVVLENRGGRRRAEGFSSHLPLGDRQARDVFRQAGYELDFVTPLIRSIILNGGYRCASQSLRSIQTR